MDKNTPMELQEDELGHVSGGVADPDGVVSSGLLGMDITSDEIKNETMLIIPII